MPSMMTHRLFADDVLAKLPSGMVREAIEHAFELFSIGSSGPDFFFFFGVWPWRDQKKSKSVHKFGSWMHEEKIDVLFQTLFSMCKETKNQLYIAYTSGVLVHWCLDHQAHPYVFNQTGRGTKKDDHLHCLFESMIDREMLERKQIRLQDFKTYDVVKHQSTTHEAIYDLYAAVIKNGWNEDLDKNDVKQCLTDFERVERFLYDPNGHKVKFVRVLEKLLGLEGYATSMIIPTKENVCWDVMNDEHRLWHHPQTNEEHTESFMEMYESALAIAKQVFAKFEAFLSGEISIEDALQLIGKKNFHTALEEPDNMKYFDLIK